MIFYRKFNEIHAIFHIRSGSLSALFCPILGRTKTQHIKPILTVPTLEIEKKLTKLDTVYLFTLVIETPYSSTIRGRHGFDVGHET